MKSKRKLPLQKAAKGLHEVTVPPPGNSGDVLNGAIAGAGTGASLSGGNPYAIAAGAVLGGAKGFYDMDSANKAHTNALNQNLTIQANNRVAGVDITQDQRGQYAQGTPAISGHKPIEVEKDELVFRKVGDKFRLKADFQKGKPHSQGGEDYMAQEGDVIFPGKQRGKVLAAYQGGNHGQLEGMRLRLPKDTNPQGEAASGADLLSNPGKPYLPPVMFENKPLYNDPQNRDGKYGAYPQAVNGLKTGDSQFYLQGEKGNPYPYGVIQNNQGSYYRHDGIPQIPGKNSLDGGVSNDFSIPASLAPMATEPANTSPASPEVTTAPQTPQGNGMGNALKYASVANNLIQGFSPPEKAQENYLDPVLQQYQDRSDPQRRQSNMVRNAQVANARNASGGNIGNLRANQQMAEAENFGRRQQIDDREQGLADNVRTGNVDITNRAKEFNSQKKDQYGAQNAQARANTQQYKDAAFGQLSSLGNAQEQDNYKKSRDVAADNLEQGKLSYLNKMYDFQTNGKGGTLDWRGPGGSYLNPTPSSSTIKVNTDIYGRKTSSTTQTSLGINRGKRK